MGGLGGPEQTQNTLVCLEITKKELEAVAREKSILGNLLRATTQLGLGHCEVNGGIISD